MKATQYHSLFTSLVTQPLANTGWVEKNHRLYWRSSTSMAALLLVGSKFSSLCQFVRYVLVFRHTFLRNLEQQDAGPFPANPFDYPAKFVPSQAFLLLSLEKITQWHYTPSNLGVDFDEITYSPSNPATSTEKYLRSLTQTLHSFVPAFTQFFTPAEAARQIKQYGENAYCEKLWLQDYRAYLSKQS